MTPRETMNNLEMALDNRLYNDKIMIMLNYLDHLVSVKTHSIEATQLIQSKIKERNLSCFFMPSPSFNGIIIIIIIFIFPHCYIRKRANCRSIPYK